MSEPELPPLPDIDWLSQFVPVYAREHMRAYGRACYALAQGEIERLRNWATDLDKDLSKAYKRSEVAERERDELRTQFEVAQKDVERMDWLEDEMRKEQVGIFSGTSVPSSLFRRNMPITRSTIDAARMEKP